MGTSGVDTIVGLALAGSTARTAGIAAAIAVATAVLAAGLGWSVRRTGARRADRSREGELEALVQELEQRVETIGSELDMAVARAREEGRQLPAAWELGTSLELEEVLRRTVDAAAAISPASTALLTVTIGGERHVIPAGLTDADLSELSIPSVPPPGRRVRAMRLAYSRGETAAEETATVTAGLAVPLPSESGIVGLLAVFARNGEGLPESALADLEALARRAGPAIDNARRFKEARQLADLDALTGLHNRRYFHETLAREVARAHRYGRRLSLLVFDLDDFKAVNDRIGHLAGDAVLGQVAERVREVVRSADVACRVGGDEFAIILPESTLEDADRLSRRLQRQLQSQPPTQVGPIGISGGVAELGPQDDALTLFQRADEALYRAKRGGKGRIDPDEPDGGGLRPR